MLTKCPQCGFKSEIRTDTSIYSCKQCGSTFRLHGDLGVLKEYIPHKSDVSIAEGVLLGELEVRGIKFDIKPEVNFIGFQPFWYGEFEDSTTFFKPAATLPKTVILPTSPPPANFQPAPDNLLLPQATIPPPQIDSPSGIFIRKLRLLHIPLYVSTIKSNGKEYYGTIIPPIWQLFLPDIPVVSEIHIPLKRMQFLGIYSVILLSAGLLAPSIWWRAILISSVVLSGWWFDKPADVVAD